MLQLFRNNSPFTVIVLLIFALLAKLQVLLHPQLMVPPPDHILYAYILHLLNIVLNNNAFGYTLLTAFLLFCQALYISAIAAKHKLFGKATYIPGFVFLLLTSIYPPFNYFSEALLVNWCLLGAVSVMLSFNQTSYPRKLIFNAGFLFAVAALLQFSALGYLLLFFIVMAALRAFQPSEWVVGILGYCTPFYFFVCILFLANKLSLLQKLPHFNIMLPQKVHAPLYLAILGFGLFILLVCGILAMQANVPKLNIYVRRNWLALVFYFIISLLVAAGGYFLTEDAWLMAIPALTFMISHALTIEKRKRFSNFIFYFSLLFLIFCQLAYK